MKTSASAADRLPADSGKMPQGDADRGPQADDADQTYRAGIAIVRSVDVDRKTKL